MRRSFSSTDALPTDTAHLFEHMALWEGGFGILPVTEVERTALSSFQCGKPHLDRFLLESAAAMHHDRLGLTHVVFHSAVSSGAVGYFTLSNDGLPLTTSEQEELGLDSKVKLGAFPAVKLGRLAVAQHLHGQGVGRHLMRLVLDLVRDTRSGSAARLLVVDADNDPPVLAFYRRLGFQDSLWAQKQARHHSGGQRSGPSITIKMVRDVLLPL